MTNKYSNELVEQSVCDQRGNDMSSIIGEGNLSLNSNTSPSSIHYVSSNENNRIDELITLTGDTETIGVEFSAQFATFFNSPELIKVPAKVEAVLKKYISKVELRKIHKDETTAVELCLIILSNFSDTHFNIQKAESPEKAAGWKRLMSVELAKQVSEYDTVTYKKIIELLIQGSASKGGIIERDDLGGYVPTVKSYSYRLCEPYREKGVVSYTLKTKDAIKLNTKTLYRALAIAEKNPIAKNLLNFYSMIDLPSVEEITAEAHRLISEKHITKKGKKLTFLNKRSKSRFKDFTSYSFVEENIELFLYLTEKRLLIPQVGSERSGGRIVDSFTLMPSWIRRLVKVNGVPMIEADFVALHPNIAMSLYNGSAEYITHQKVAHELNIDVKEVKIHHLSFFNMTWLQMSKNPLFSFYATTEPRMMETIFHSKTDFILGHKITSREMFKKEVEIMTEVITELNRRGIYVGYIYDALFTSPENIETVLEVMNEVVLNNNVKTKAK